MLFFWSFFCYSKPMMIRIFAMKVSGQDFTESCWERYLSQERKLEAEKRKNEKERQLFLAAEILLNRSLECIGANIKLPALYERNQYGKPYLIQNEAIKVNWSHSGEYVACVVADREVGIDLQYAKKGPKKSLIQKTLQPEELAFYENAREEKTRLFYKFWTLKESYLKAIGTGFHTPLQTFYVQMDSADPVIVERGSAGKEQNYYCKLLEFADPDYAAAVCSRKETKREEEPEEIEIEYFV